MPRISKENYYLDIAETVLERATCLRRVYGAIIVKNDEIISTGYNGAPRGRKNCVDLGFCTREELQVPARRALRALPQRPRRGERHYLGLPARHGRRHHLSCGPRRAHGRAAARRDELCHVPPPDHQRGAGKGGHPPHGDGVRGRARAAVDRRGRFSSRSIRKEGLFQEAFFFLFRFQRQNFSMY